MDKAEMNVAFDTSRISFSRGLFNRVGSQV